MTRECHDWHKGALDVQAWHNLATIVPFTDAQSLIRAGEQTGAWPTALHSETLTTTSGLVVPDKAIVGSYDGHSARVLGVNSSKYHAMHPEDWRGLVQAAVAAGAQPTGAFSLAGGSKVLATFKVGKANGLVTNLLIVDSFDRSCSATAGFTSIRVVCRNTMTASFRQDGAGMAKLRHTKQLESKVAILQEAIGQAIKGGDSVRAKYEQAEATILDRESAKKVFDALFPEAEKDASQAMVTRAQNVRREAMQAAALPVNKVGDKGTLATLWNAATYLVDRNVNGSLRQTRGSVDPIDSLLFEGRAKRLAEIQETIEATLEIVMKDGTVQHMPVSEARSHGIDDKQIGAKLLQDMLS